jgi:hypothetical protein
MAEVAIPRNLFGDILPLIAELRPSPDPAPQTAKVRYRGNTEDICSL